MARPCQLLLCVLILAPVAIVCGRTFNPSANRKADFDFFYLVRQWPATFCNEHSCTHRPPRRYAFTVHGLWPERNDHTWPQFCDPGSELDEDTIEDLLPEMEEVWPSWSSDDATFWNHEWTRHGTCAESVIGGQHAFFKTVLKLHRKLNIQEALQSADIVPSNKQQYPVQQLKDAIEEAYGVVPHITCDEQGELAEVWMCVSKKLKPIDCVDDPHPHRSLSAAGGAQVRAPAPNWDCKYVTIPKLKDNSLQVEGGEPLTPTAVQQQGAALQDLTSASRPFAGDTTVVTYPEHQRVDDDSAAGGEYQIGSDREPDVFASVSFDSTPASTIEEHVAQLVALDQEQEVQQQSVADVQGVADDDAATPQHIIEQRSDVGARQSQGAVSNHHHTLLVIPAVLLVASAVIVAAVVVLKLSLQPVTADALHCVAEPVSRHPSSDVAVDTTPLLNASLAAQGLGLSGSSGSVVV